MNTKKRVKSGIVGTGFSGSFHYEAIQKVYGTDVMLMGAYDADPERTKAYAEARNIQAYTDLDELIDDCDVVHVCAIVAAHEELAIRILEKDKYVILEKPMIGYCGDGTEAFNGDTFPREDGVKQASESLKRLLAAEAKSKGQILYAENWVYAPSIQKEREILEKTGAQVLWMHGEEAHSGSHSPAYAEWKCSGGGVMLGKGCHPLTAALYLKRVEGLARDGNPIRPVTVSARVHAITRMERFRDEGHLRSNYHDIDDFSMMHVVFEDGSIADIFASDIVMGGIHNELEVCANNHRTVCSINPNTAMQTYNPVEANFKDIYTVEKACTKQGWSCTSPDEDWFTGYPQEIEAFYRTVAYGDRVESDSGLGADCIMTIYCAYLSSERKGQEVEIELL
ncbi:MAG: Gfo/Idh/MocA family oxidoreductase [Verrucomicrobia bacterium]|jgi:predicted dehydrogenase|nr:Gfo/Idh/MocA family oxidoreductase [Verrucomicrobiota bacterium]